MRTQSVKVGEQLEGNKGWNPFLGSVVVGRSGQLRETGGGKTEETLASAESRNLKKGGGGRFSVQSLPLPSIFPLSGCQPLLF